MISGKEAQSTILYFILFADKTVFVIYVEVNYDNSNLHVFFFDFDGSVLIDSTVSKESFLVRSNRCHDQKDRITN